MKAAVRRDQGCTELLMKLPMRRLSEGVRDTLQETIVREVTSTEEYLKVWAGRADVLQATDVFVRCPLSASDCCSFG